MASISRDAIATARTRVFDELVDANDAIDTCIVPKIPTAMIDRVMTSSIIVNPASVSPRGMACRIDTPLPLNAERLPSVLEGITGGVGCGALRGGDNRCSAGGLAVHCARDRSRRDRGSRR